MKKSLVIALLLATARAEEEAAADAEEKKGAEENYACDSATEETGCADTLRCQLRPALTAFWTAEELAVQDKKTLEAHNSAEAAANVTARSDWDAAKKKLDDYETAKNTWNGKDKAAKDDAKTNADAKDAYDTAKKKCADAAQPAVAVADYTGGVGANDVCAKTVAFVAGDAAATTVTIDLAAQTIDPAAGPPQVLGATGMVATLTYTLTTSKDGNSQKVDFVSVAYGPTGTANIDDPPTIAAYVAANALAGTTAGNVGYLLKGTDAFPAFAAEADIANLSADLPNPAYTALNPQPVATPAVAPAAWDGGDAPALAPAEKPALYVALKELPAAKKAKPEGSRAAAGATAAPAATGEAADGEEAKEEEDPADGPGVCVPEAECDKEGVFCGAAQLTAGLIVSLALAASL